jgi:hypothetical protein
MQTIDKSAWDSAEAALAAASAVGLTEWHPVTPRDTWLRTRKEGEDGENVCMLPSFNDVDEWIEKVGGRTTVTHHSFAAPTHWALLSPPTPEEKEETA